MVKIVNDNTCTLIFNGIIVRYLYGNIRYPAVTRDRCNCKKANVCHFKAYIVQVLKTIVYKIAHVTRGFKLPI